MLKELKCVHCEKVGMYPVTQENVAKNLFDTKCSYCEAVGFMEFVKPLNEFEEAVLERGSLPGCASPGGYPIYYVSGGDVLCAECATKTPHVIEAHDIHWEGAPMNCDDCGAVIESAYGDPEEDGE